MADFTQTITNSLNLFGPAPATKWGTNTPYTMTWGSSKWGEGTEDLQVSVEKLITDDITLDGATLAFSVIKVYSNGITITSEPTSETLQTSNGYYYLFVLPTSEAESRNLSTFTEGSAPSTTYTSSTASSPTWS